MQKMYKISEVMFDTMEDLIDSYLHLLENTVEEDEFMDGLRQSRIMDCEDALFELNRLKEKVNGTH